MPKKSIDNRDRDERREDALRPCPYLGYDRDSLAMHLLSRGACEIAETQFRRAIWLNPFEAMFKAHLAWCLYREGRHAEAQTWITQALEQEPNNQEHQRIHRLIEQGLERLEAEHKPRQEAP